jgi:hypothetical protein
MKSTTPVRDLTAAARAGLAGNWGKSIGVTLVYILLSACISVVPLVGEVMSVVFSAPLVVGLTVYFLATLRSQHSRFNQLFEGFSRFGQNLFGEILMETVGAQNTLHLDVRIVAVAEVFNNNAGQRLERITPGIEF